MRAEQSRAEQSRAEGRSSRGEESDDDVRPRFVSTGGLKSTSGSALHVLALVTARKLCGCVGVWVCRRVCQVSQLQLTLSMSSERTFKCAFQYPEQCRGDWQ